MDEQLPYPPTEDLPPAWHDMSNIERAFFVYGWRVEHGYLPKRQGADALEEAGFTVYEL